MTTLHEGGGRQQLGCRDHALAAAPVDARLEHTVNVRLPGPGGEGRPPRRCSIIRGVPVSLRPADPAAVSAAVARLRDGTGGDDDLRLLVQHFLAVLMARAPGRAVELRVPPYAAVQVVGGTTHKRGRPPAVVETDGPTWVGLALGDVSWSDAGHDGRLSATGERSDLSAYLPLT